MLHGNVGDPPAVCHQHLPVDYTGNRVALANALSFTGELKDAR
jgi:hypothetical protein